MLTDQFQPNALPPAVLNSSGFTAWCRSYFWQARLPALLLHALLFVALYSALYCFGILRHAPETERLLNWDSSIYRSISEVGYDDPGSGRNAFFPLFPYIWRYSQLGPLGITVLSMSCALVGASVLAYTFRLSTQQVLLVVSLPAMMFTFVPYSEGLFFLFASLLLRGLHCRSLSLTLIALLVCCLTRAATTIFIPSFLFAEVLNWDNTKPFSQRSWVRIVTGMLTMLGALAVVMYTEYVQTGDALAFYKVQLLWNHIYRNPEFPLTSTAGINVLWLDGIALLLALVSTTACLLLGGRWLSRLFSQRTKTGTPTLPISRAVLFSLSYCVGAGFFIVMFQGGEIANLSRYVLATPFPGVLLWQLWQLRPASGRIISVGAASCLCVALALGFPFRFDNFVPAEATWYFSLFSAYVFAFIFSAKGSSPWYREIGTTLYIINLLLMAYLHNLFLDGTWIG